MHGAEDHVVKGTLLTPESFIEQALDDYEAALIGYATTLVQDSHLARDVVQDVFLHLCHQEPAKVERHLRPWLFSVCRKYALDVLRKTQRSSPSDGLCWRKVAGVTLPPDEQLIQRERYAKASSHLAELPALQRELIILKFQQNLSYREIQQITRLKPGNIGLLIHSALTKLREMIRNDSEL